MGKRFTPFIFVCILCALVVILFYAINFRQTKSIEIIFSDYQIEDDVHDDGLFDLRLKYLLSSEQCGNDTFAVLIVTSYFGNVETRSAMRRAFSNQELWDFKIRRVFLLGVAPGDKYTNQRSVNDESRRFGDLLQGNFVEAYRNLTYKHMMGLKWVATNCKAARYVMKMDDDIVVNVKGVVEMLRSNLLPAGKLVGYVLRNMSPVREPANKWFVTKQEYEKTFYPTFLSGWFYIITPNISMQLVKASKTTPYLWIDDVYVTGILADKLNLQHYEINKYFTTYPEFLQCCIRDLKTYNYNCDILVGPNGGDNNLFYAFNEAIKFCNEEKPCKKRPKPLEETCVGERKTNLGKGNALVQTYQLF